MGCRRLQALPHDLRCQVLRQRSRRRLRGDEDRRGHDRRRPPEGPDGVKVNIFGCLLIKASRTELPGRHKRKKNHQIIIAIINQRFSIGINEDLLNLESGNQTSELQQYKSKPSYLENALKLRYMPSLKLNYSSGAFSRALLHNKKVRTRYFGDETS